MVFPPWRGLPCGGRRAGRCASGPVLGPWQMELEEVPRMDPEARILMDVHGFPMNLDGFSLFCLWMLMDFDG